MASIVATGKKDLFLSDETILPFSPSSNWLRRKNSGDKIHSNAFRSSSVSLQDDELELTPLNIVIT